jgi:tetratricopeptide (TPR) repeat protein
VDDKKRSTDVDFGYMSQDMLQPGTAQNLFQEALGLQNQKKIDDALALYQKILDLGLADASNLTNEQASAVSQNMSLIYFQKKESALAYVYNQKALNLDQGNNVAVDFQKQNKNLFQTTSVPRDISFFENINSMGLKYLSIELLFVNRFSERRRPCF